MCGFLVNFGMQTNTGQALRFSGLFTRTGNLATAISARLVLVLPRARIPIRPIPGIIPFFDHFARKLMAAYWDSPRI